MGLKIEAVSRKQSSSLGALNDEHAAAYADSLEFFSNPENYDQDVKIDFESSRERNAFTKYARAQATVDGMRFRAVVNEKDSARLVFRMESEADYLRRKAEKEAADADREARRAAGEVIKPGRKKA